VITFCTIIEKASISINTCTSTYWDMVKDGTVVVKYEGRTFVSILNLYACNIKEKKT
jgi:hypothetical protein